MRSCQIPSGEMMVSKSPPQTSRLSRLGRGELVGLQRHGRRLAQQRQLAGDFADVVAVEAELVRRTDGVWPRQKSGPAGACRMPVPVFTEASKLISTCQPCLHGELHAVPFLSKRPLLTEAPKWRFEGHERVAGSIRVAGAVWATPAVSVVAAAERRGFAHGKVPESRRKAKGTGNWSEPPTSARA